MKNMLGERFWWPDIEHGVTWYVKTCHCYQERIIEIPPTVMHTPSIFQLLNGIGSFVKLCGQTE